MSRAAWAGNAGPAWSSLHAPALTDVPHALQSPFPTVLKSLMALWGDAPQWRKQWWSSHLLLLQEVIGLSNAGCDSVTQTMRLPVLAALPGGAIVVHMHDLVLKLSVLR